MQELWLTATIGIYVAATAATAWYAFIRKRSGLFEPISHYMAFMALFTLPLPIRAAITPEIKGDVTPFLWDIYPYLPFAVLMSGLSLPLFAACYYSAGPTALARRLVALRDLDGQRPLLAFAILGGLALFLISRLAEPAGGILPFLLLGYNASALMFGKGHLALGFPLLFIATLFLLQAFTRKRTWTRLILFIAAFAAVIAMQVLFGNRSQILYYLIVVGTYVHLAIRPITLKLAVPLGFVSFLALNLLGFLRHSNYESIDQYLGSFSRSGDVIADSGGAGLFYTLTTGEFVVPFETLPQMIRTVGVTTSPWWGLSYLRSPIYLVPNALYPDRPVPLTTWYMQDFYGLGENLNEGRGFFFLSEAYLNFGFLGVVLLALLWGLLWGAVQRWIERPDTGSDALLVYALLVGFLFRCIAGDAVTLVSGALQQSLGPVLLGLFISRGMAHQEYTLEKRCKTTSKAKREAARTLG